jgi:hypothetical protein
MAQVGYCDGSNSWPGREVRRLIDALLIQWSSCRIAWRGVTFLAKHFADTYSRIGLPVVGD